MLKQLYHVTDESNKVDIINNGLQPQVTNAITNSEEQINKTGIFFFDNVESAEEFAMMNSLDPVIFTTQIDENYLIIDPEYDGEALFYETTSYYTYLKII